MRTTTADAAQPIHEIRVPEDLLAWGKDPVRARSWAKPWAHQLDRMLRYAETHVLTSSETDAVLTTLEALCAEAVRAGEHELLLGLDLYTAEWLGLKFDVEVEDPYGEKTTITFGEDWAYSELHALVEAGPKCVPAAMKAKALVSEVFPQARIDAMIRTEEMPQVVCAGCGERDATVTVSLEHGSRYCRVCYTRMTRESSEGT